MTQKRAAIGDADSAGERANAAKRCAIADGNRPAERAADPQRSGRNGGRPGKIPGVCRQLKQSAASLQQRARSGQGAAIISIGDLI